MNLIILTMIDGRHKWPGINRGNIVLRRNIKRRILNLRDGEVKRLVVVGKKGSSYPKERGFFQDQAVTKLELLERLRQILDRGSSDPESDHADADDALLDYISDSEVRELYDEIERWYA